MIDPATLKNHVLHEQVQAIVLNENGYVLSSDNTLIEIESDTPLIEEADVFIGIDQLIYDLEINETFKLDCIETEFHSRYSIYDFVFKRLEDEVDSKRYLLLLYDLEDVYTKVIDLRRERNEAKIYADKLAVAHNELKQAQLHLVSNERMATIGLLAAGMAHEINNPLNYILNGVELIKRNLEENDTKEMKSLEMLKIIETGAERIQEVVSRLKIFDSTGHNEQKEIDLNAAIDQTTDLVVDRMNKSVNITRVYASEELLLRCNPGKISQALFNLLLNAVTFSKGVDEPNIRVETEVDSKKIRILVKDNGSGIPDEIKEQVMEPFFTTKKMGTGKGLGLSVANILIQESGGELSFESKEGKGSTFCIELYAK